VVLGCSFIAFAGIEIPQRKYQLRLKSLLGCQYIARELG